MKRVKILALIGIIIAVVGFGGGFIKFGIYASLAVFGFLLWLSIEVRILKTTKINESMKPFKINWKKVLIATLIIYVLLWSYLYLGIQYAEHRQKYLSRVYDNCREMSKESLEGCINFYKENGIRELFIFRPIIKK